VAKKIYEEIMNVPFNDLKLQYLQIKDEIDPAMQAVIEETAFIRGKYVNRFEQQYAEAYDVKHCISCANGTDAIFLVLKALGIGPGDEVITTASSWIASSETITLAGAQVVFVDIEPNYYTIDIDKIEANISSKTKAIIPVHLYGQAADMVRLKKLCDSYGLYLIEDCAQAHFVECNGKKVGTFGNAGTFSFYPGKNLGAYGDAGAVVTNDDELAEKVRMIANHGSLKKHEHQIEGVNSRLDGLQAAVLSVKLKYILDWNKKRMQHALYYNQHLQNVPQVQTPVIRSNCSHCFHLYVIRTEGRDVLQSYLKQHGVATGVHYPSPLPFLKAYEYLCYQPEDLPVVADYQRQILSLPMFPELSYPQIDYVIDTIKNFFATYK
jgi:dTDP-4-amino-4,6-dideoxygalactose transaminase